LATQILRFQPIKANFVYEVLQNYLKQILFLEPAVTAKMLTFVLATEKRLVRYLVVLVWTFFQIFQ